MLRKILISFVLFTACAVGFAAYADPKYVPVSGTVTEYGTEIPVIGAAVRLGEDYLWTTTDIDGKFALDKVQPVDMFCWTSGVECVAQFSKSANL